MFEDSQVAAIYQWGVVLVASLIAALTDIQNRRIPNWLTVPVFLAGLIHAGAVGGFSELISSFLAALILMAPYVILFLFAGGGAGDAKLMAAVGAWLGLNSGIIALVTISIFAIIFALLKAASKKRFFAVLKNIRDMIISFFLLFKVTGWRKAGTEAIAVNDGRPLETMPYAPAIFAGLLAAAVYSIVQSS
jgi:prepilin peptidase CpaA